MSNIIEELFYGNLEPQELTTEITPRLKKKLSELVKKEEELKERDRHEWVQRMGNIQQRAREIVCSKLIYS